MSKKENQLWISNHNDHNYIKVRCYTYENHFSHYDWESALYDFTENKDSSGNECTISKKYCIITVDYISPRQKNYRILHNILLR